MSDSTITPYDLLRGDLRDVSTSTKPTTIQSFEPITGRAITYIITTYRNEQGDYIFIEQIGGDASAQRIYIPPKGSAAIAAQRDSLTTRRRSAAATARAKTLTEEQKQVLRDRLAAHRTKALKASLKARKQKQAKKKAVLKEGPKALKELFA